MKSSEIEIGGWYLVREWLKPVAKARPLDAEIRLGVSLGFPGAWAHWKAQVVGRDGQRWVITWERSRAVARSPWPEGKVTWVVEQVQASVRPTQIVRPVAERCTA